ncbi:MAG: hypothetical protein HYZ54_04770 [Ignavibacteriae bacterium]|nr:hypothetical protein [Ignavibacteriota bacterium]
MKLTLPDHIVEYLQKLCKENEVHLLEAVLRGSPQKMLLEVFIDSETGIVHSNCKNIGKSLNDLSETDEFLSKVSQIEVSSPGADQPLRFPWQYSKHIGRVLECNLKNKIKIQGKLISADAESITLALKPSKSPKITTEQSANEMTVPFSDIVSSKVVISFV